MKLDWLKFENFYYCPITEPVILIFCISLYICGKNEYLSRKLSYKSVNCKKFKISMTKLFESLIFQIKVDVRGQCLNIWLRNIFTYPYVKKSAKIVGEL